MGVHNGDKAVYSYQEAGCICGSESFLALKKLKCGKMHEKRGTLPRGRPFRTFRFTHIRAFSSSSFAEQAELISPILKL